MLLMGRKSIKLLKGGAWTLGDAKCISSLDTALLDPSYAQSARGVAIDPTGKKIYTTVYPNQLIAIDLSVAGDLTSAYSSTSIDLSLNALAELLRFNIDGDRLYISTRADSNTTNLIYQYDLSTAWDISTATFTKSYTYTDFTYGSGMLDFSTDGSYMYLAANEANLKDIVIYKLDTPWEIDSISTSTTYTPTEHTISGTFSTDGKYLFYLLWIEGMPNIARIPLDTPWDLDTWRLDKKSIDLLCPQPFAQGLAFSPSGKDLYSVDTNNHLLLHTQLARGEWGGTPTPPPIDLSAGLMSHYPLQTDAYDIYNRDQDGVLVGDLHFVDNSAVFNGTDGYIDIGWAPIYGFTISLYVKIDTLTQAGVLVQFNIAGQRLSLYWSGFGENDIGLFYGESDHWNVPNAIQSAGVWHHVVWKVVDNNDPSHQVFIDNIEKTLINKGGPHGGTADSRIGAGADGGELFKGSLANMRTYSEIKDTDFIEALYLEGR